MKGARETEGHERGAGEEEISGDWVTPAVSYIDPERRFCTLCGRPIARRYWQVRIGSEALPFCTPAHAILYATYPHSHSQATVSC